MKTTSALSLFLSVVAISIQAETEDNIFASHTVQMPLEPPEGQVYPAEEIVVSNVGTATDGPPAPGEDATVNKNLTKEEWDNVPWPKEESSTESVIVSNLQQGCNFVLETQYDCYDWSGPDGNGPVRILMKVENCDRSPSDWLGLYEAAGRNNEVGQLRPNPSSYWADAYLWNYVPFQQYFFFTFSNFWWQWLGNRRRVPDGEYRIFLFASNGYRVKAASEPFTVRNDYDFCDPPGPTAPTEVPTFFPTENPTCFDVPFFFRLRGGKRVRCRWARGRQTRRKCRTRLAGRRRRRVQDLCPATCGKC